jgi:hypothetical protein
MLGDAGVIGTTDCPSLTLLLEHCIYTHSLRPWYISRPDLANGRRVWPPSSAHHPILSIMYHVPCHIPQLINRYILSV